MHKRWASGFSIVELLIIIAVIAILFTITVVGYTGVQKNALVRAAQSDLSNVAAEMERSHQKAGNYPSVLPNSLKATDKITLTVVGAGSSPYYSGLSAVQNGVLLSQICNDLINENVGKGVDQGGTTRDYIMGCGNWNSNSMQVTGWATRVWNTPVRKDQLSNYASTYTVSDTFHKSAQETAVKNFYNQMVSRLEQQGGSFPVTSFWDSWATSGNGGVMIQTLSASPQLRPFYCVQATISNSTEVWHVDQSARIQPGSC